MITLKVSEIVQLREVVVEWWLPEAGKRGIMESCYSMSIKFTYAQ